MVSRWSRATTHMPIFKTGLVPFGNLMTSVLSLTILVICTRRGLFADIAAFSAGSAFVAIGAAVLSGGSTLVFVNGDSRSRQAVSFLRLRFVAPALLVTGAIGSLTLAAGTHFVFWSVLAGGVSVCFNNLAELESSRLKGQLATGSVLIATVFSRLVGVGLAIYTNYSLAMFAASLTFFIGLTAASRLFCASEASSSITWRESFRTTYSLRFVLVAVLDTVVIRAPFIAIGAATFDRSADSLSSLLTVQQAICSVLLAGVFATMSVRGRIGRSELWMGRVDKISLSLAVVGAAGIILFSGSIVEAIGVESAEATTWFALLALGIIPNVANRVQQYRNHSESAWPLIFARLTSAALVTLFMLPFAIAIGSPLLLASIWLMAESTGFLVGLLVRIYISRSTSR